MPVRFTSNNFENGRGFQFGYKSTYVAPDMTYRIGECGGNFTTKSGLFTSPSFPEKYPINVDCVWTISRPNGSLIRIEFMSMDMEMVWSQCYDYVEIRDGASESSPLLGKVCGDDIPTPQLSTQNNLWIR